LNAKQKVKISETQKQTIVMKKWICYDLNKNLTNLFCWELFSPKAKRQKSWLWTDKKTNSKTNGTFCWLLCMRMPYENYHLFIILLFDWNEGKIYKLKWIFLEFFVFKLVIKWAEKVVASDKNLHCNLNVSCIPLLYSSYPSLTLFQSPFLLVDLSLSLSLSLSLCIFF